MGVRPVRGGDEYGGRKASEFGIRLALGEESRSIIVSVLRHGALLATGGCVAGFLVGLAASTVIQSLLYDTDPRDAATYLGATAAFFAVALVASFIPAWRAGRVDPVAVLRGD